MKAVFLFFLYLCLSLASFAQNAKELERAEKLERAKELDDLANTYSINKEYDKAIKAWEECVAIYRSGEFAEIFLETTLTSLELDYYLNKEYDKAIKTGEEALALSKKIFKKPNTYLLGRLIVDYMIIENYPKAVEYQVLLIDIIKQTKGEECKEYAKEISRLHKDCKYAPYKEALKDLALKYSQEKDFQKAVDTQILLVEATKQNDGADNSDYAMTLQNLATYCLNNYNFKKAIEAGTKSADILRKNAKDDVSRLNLGVSLYLLFMSYSVLDYQNSISYGLEAIDVFEKVSGLFKVMAKTDKLCLDIMIDLSSVYSSAGMFVKAEETLENVSKQIGKKRNEEAARVLEQKSTILAEKGEYVHAVETIKQAIEIIKNKKETTEMYIGCLFKLARFYKLIGNTNLRDEAGNEALNLAKKFYSENSTEYLSRLIEYNTLEYEPKDKYLALEKAKENHALCEKTINIKADIRYISSLFSLADRYYKSYDYERALELTEEVIALYREFYYDSGLMLDGCLSAKCMYLTALAFRNNQRDLLPKAIEAGKEALDDFEKQSNIQPTTYREILGPLSLAYIYSDSIEASALLYRRLFNFQHNQIVNNFREMTSNERRFLWIENQDIITENMYPYCSMSGDYTLFQDLSYDGSLFSKSLLLNSELSLNTLIQENGDTKTIALFKQLKSLDEDIVIEKNKEKQKSLEQKQQALERELMQRSQIYGDYTHNLTVKWQDVQETLTDNDIAIEFVDFNPIIFDTIVPTNRTYAALLLKKGWEHPKMVRLFRKGELDSLALQKDSKIFMNADMETDQNMIYESAALGNLIWSPLEEYLQGIKNIYFAPSGILHQLAVEYLPTGKGNMQERFNLFRLSSTRQLAVKKQDNEQNKTILYGDLDYGSKSTKNLLASANDSEDLSEITMRKVIDELSLSNVEIAPLKYTKEEIENINGLLSKNGMASTVFSGTAGTETSFKTLSGQKIKRLHIATHGFYLPDEEKSESSKEDMSLYRAGLFMAENIKSTTDDGILTAKEIAQTDLRGLDLVVLSACQTGLGEVTGEGVFGLQRGFKKAGARTLLMSLWSVNDEATAIMMSRFYEYFLSGKSKREAFLSAQNDLRNYEKNGRKIFDKPQFWAAFILLDA
jgi:CHAT domain-containing protein